MGLLFLPNWGCVKEPTCGDPYFKRYSGCPPGGVKMVFLNRFARRLPISFTLSGTAWCHQQTVIISKPLLTQHSAANSDKQSWLPTRVTRQCSSLLDSCFLSQSLAPSGVKVSVSQGVSINTMVVCVFPGVTCVITWQNLSNREITTERAKL